MRKFALIIAVLFVGAFAESKEENVNDGVEVGIRGGVHLMTMGTLDLSAGWHIGAVRDVKKLADLELFGSIYLQPGLLFFTKTSWFDTKTYWLEVPVLASWKFKSSSGIYRFNIGPYFNLGLFGDFEDKFGTALNGLDDETETETEIETLNRFDLGLSIGTGVELWKFWLGASYNYGFISVSNYHDGSSASARLTLGFNI